MLGREKNRDIVKWREAFTRDDRAFFHEGAGEMMAQLGYEPNDTWIDGE